MDPFTDADRAYLAREFVSLDVLCDEKGRSRAEVFAWIAHRLLPSPTYATPDGTAWVPRDYFLLLDEAGTPAGIRALFERRYRDEAARRGEAVLPERLEADWNGYLGGGFGACLREVTPEHIFRKEQLVRLLTAQLAAPEPEDPSWCGPLRERVEELDRLEKPFAPYDRLRFGGPVSRDRLISAARQRHPAIFAAPCAAAAVPVTSAP